MDDGHAEDGHHRVADELLHGSAVRLERAAHLVEVAPHHAAHRLRVEPLAERRRAGHVGEDDRHDLAGLPLGSGLRESGAAGRAETGPRTRFLAALGASRHEPNLRREDPLPEEREKCGGAGEWGEQHPEPRIGDD